MSQAMVHTHKWRVLATVGALVMGALVVDTLSVPSAGATEVPATRPFVVRPAVSQAPTVTTEAATAVSLSTATLVGTVNPNGLQTTYQFQYGTSTSYGAATTLETVGSGTSAVPVTADISGLSSDTTYDFRLVANNTQGTGYGANLTFTTGAVPSVVTEAATAVSLNAAALQGTVNPNGLQTTYQFQYGTSTSYGLVSPPSPQGIGSGTSAVPVTADISGLSSGTTYDFRLVATNTQGTGYGANLTFTTGAVPGAVPSAVTEAATGVSLNAAALQGTVNPNGLQTTYQFQYGTSTSYGLVSPPSPQGIGSGTSAVPVTADISGLSSGTTYDFRLVATNTQGTGYGANLTFTTGQLPSAPSGGQQGYVWVNPAGEVVTYGDVSFYGDLYTEGYTGLSGRHPLPSRIVGASPLANGRGYYLVAADGSVYSFGAAPFLGSMYGRYANGTITGIAVAPGRGYYLVSSRGSVWNFGAPFFGSRRGLYVNGTITGIAVAPGRGYYLVSSRGSVWNFGAPFFGSLRGRAPHTSLMGIWVNANGTAYILFDEHGRSFGFAEEVR
ncbi:MAG: hypothetical protein ACYCZ8_18225 [Acidimicrobiales bacterium]